MVEDSISDDGNSYALPESQQTADEEILVKELCQAARNDGKQVVAVQGLGFVGAVNAAVIAHTMKDGKEPYFVLGVDLPTESTYWKILEINKGLCPYRAEDPKVAPTFHDVVVKRRNLRATWVAEAFRQADIILVDINLDVDKKPIGKAKGSPVAMKHFQEAIRHVGELMKPDALLLVETTVPPGTVENIVNPALLELFKKRQIDVHKWPPLIAHSYERVMPGKDYVDSIRKMWRSYSGVNEKATEKAREFLSNTTDVSDFPLWHLPRPNATEIAKVLENSYRAMNIAFIHEWTLFAEDIGINLFEVIDSIKVRKGTHDNMMYPGFGVGGYCLSKDGLLADWASRKIFKRSSHLDLSVKAIDVNDLMPLHTYGLLSRGLKHEVRNSKIAILGASYRKDVGDTRNSPTIVLYDKIVEAGGKPFVHDPYATVFDQRTDIAIHPRLEDVLRSADAVVFVVDHSDYTNLRLEELTRSVRKNACIVDAFNILDDEKLRILNDTGYTVVGVGKGHLANL